MAGVIANRISFHLSADVVAGEAVVGEEQDVRGLGGDQAEGVFDGLRDGGFALNAPSGRV